MKIFLSSLENSKSTKSEGSVPIAELLVKQGVQMKWNLMSYYYIRKGGYDIAQYIRNNSKQVLIDSGAHSFQKGVKVDWVKYTKEYAEFIKQYDRPNVIGYFEMDVDSIIGYDNVKKLRKILTAVTNKIIPVWHKNRGIDDFKQMCKDYSGRIIGITGFKNEDIKDSQYLMFVKYAHEHNCKVHCLGMTRKQVLDKVPFDYTDSSSWSASARYGRIGERKVTREMSKTRRGVVFVESYKHFMKMQEHYYRKWKKVCKD